MCQNVLILVETVFFHGNPPKAPFIEHEYHAYDDIHIVMMFG